MNSKDKSKNKSKNPDLITGEPGSHPVGTGVGAAGAGAAGAAIGAVGGPIGSAAGAVVGAIVGGLGGKAAGEAMNPTGNLERYLDYTVVDQSGDKVGSVDGVWQDESGQPYYLAVRTGWLHMGKAHVVPAHNAQVDEANRRIKLPFEAALMKDAPAFASEQDLTAESHQTIREYFGLGDDEGASAMSESDDEDVSSPRETNGEEADLTLKAEEIKVGKREVEYGGVRLRRIVRTERVNQPIDLQREEIVIERTPVSGEATTPVGGAGFSNEEIYIPLRREEAVVEKSVRETERIRVGKRHETDHEEISETTRREDVEIDRDAGTRPSKGSSVIADSDGRV